MKSVLAYFIVLYSKKYYFARKLSLRYRNTSFFHYIFEFSDFTFFRAARYSNISHCLIICVDPQLKRDFPFVVLVRFTMENNSNGTIRWYPYTFSRKQTTRLEVGSFELYFFGKMPKNVLMYG